MIRKLSIAGAVLVLVSTVYVGASPQQSPRGENGFSAHQNDGKVPPCQGDGSGWGRRAHGRNNGGGAAQTLAGTVTAVNMGMGQGFPNFTLEVQGKPFTIVTSPFRLLLDTGFEVSAGDRMSVQAFPSTRHDGVYVAAELNNERTRKSLTLRDAQGFPNSAAGAGHCRCGDCPRQ